MNISLTGKTAVICGSTQGIGLAIAREFALNGASCILIARNESLLKEATGQLQASPSQQHSYEVADFSQLQQVKDTALKIATANKVHILVNNTGGPSAGPIIDATEDEFLQGFTQHLICNQVLARAFVPAMKDAGYGRIINIISTSVKIPLKNLGVSNTIRGAVASWAKTLSNELGQYGITVNNVLPGLTETQRLASLTESIARNAGKTKEQVRSEMLAEIPLKRFGQASELADFASFLASPAAGYISGVSVAVDGGKTGTI